MEPMTAIVLIASKHGIAKTLNALSGQLGAGDLAVKLFEELTKSEEGLNEQVMRKLAALDSRFDDVLEQRYVTAMGAGQRTLLDAGTTADVRARTEDLAHATNLFREAGAAARSTLQAAVAERYLVLCAIARGRPDAARTALRRLDQATFEALLEADRASSLDQARVDAGDRAERELGRRTKPAAFEARRGELLTQALEAAVESGRLLGNLVAESAVLAEGLGIAPVPDLRMRAPEDLRPEVDSWLRPPVEDSRWSTRPARAPLKYGIGTWEVSAQGPARVGPLWVEWHDVRVRDGGPLPLDQAEPIAAASADTLGRYPRGAGGGASSAAGAGAGAGVIQPGATGDVDTGGPNPPLPEPEVYLLDVDLAVRVDSPLSRQVSLSVWGIPGAGTYDGAGGYLGEGVTERRLRATLLTSSPATTCTLSVARLFWFHHEVAGPIG